MRTVRADGEEASTNYQGLVVRKGAQDQTMFHMYLFFSVVLLFLFYKFFKNKKVFLCDCVWALHGFRGWFCPG